MKGWVIIHRKISENKYWLKEPFTKGQAWVDLILLATHKPTNLEKRGIEMSLDRGELAWSEDSLARRWQWSRGKVRRFLKRLESDQQIVQLKNYTISKIRLVNYDLYQRNDTGDSTADGTADSTNNNNVKQCKTIDGMFNSTSDDYLEGEVNYDDDGSLVPLVEKKKAPKYPNAPAVRKLFQEILGRNPAIWRTNRAELQSCENLWEERGPDKIRNALEFFADNHDDQYCPQAHSPNQLDKNWSKLSAYKTKKYGA